MPRHKEFNPEDCLSRVMHLFWEKGFQNTSMADLVEISGVQRYGLYETFGSKQELFQKSLDLYLNTVVSQLLSTLERKESKPSLAEIKLFFSYFIEYLDTPPSSLGCLICNSAIEVGTKDIVVDSKVKQYLERLRECFSRALTNAQRDGEISKNTDISQNTEFLVGSAFGMFMYAKSPAPRENVKAYIDTILSIIEKL